MKANRKNRKLEFIREKNKLRTGELKYYFMIKIGAMESGTNVMTAIDKAVIEADKRVKAKYNLRLPKEDFQLGQIGNDFNDNLITARITLSIK